MPGPASEHNPLTLPPLGYAYLFESDGPTESEKSRSGPSTFGGDRIGWETNPNPLQLPPRIQDESTRQPSTSPQSSKAGKSTHSKDVSIRSGGDRSKKKESSRRGKSEEPQMPE